MLKHCTAGSILLVSEIINIPKNNRNMAITDEIYIVTIKSQFRIINLKI